MNVMTESEFEAEGMTWSQVLCLVQLQAHKCWSSCARREKWKCSPCEQSYRSPKTTFPIRGIS